MTLKEIFSQKPLPRLGSLTGYPARFAGGLETPLM